MVTHTVRSIPSRLGLGGALPVLLAAALSSAPTAAQAPTGAQVPTTAHAPTGAQEEAVVGSEVTIGLIGGDVVSGTVLEAHGDRLVISHPLFGMLTVPVIEIAPPPEPEPEPEISPWSGTFDFSAKGSRGNSKNDQTRASIELLFDDKETTRDRIYARTRKDRDDGDDTANNSYAVVRREWYLEETEWRPFVQASMEWDDFTDWRRQQTVSAGGAYTLIDEEQVELNGRVGFALNRKLSGDEADGWQKELLLGGDWRWDITDGQRFKANMDIYPSLEERGDFRTVTGLSYEQDIGADETPWIFKLGFDHRYDAMPGDDTKKGDYDYYVGLGYRF